VEELRYANDAIEVVVLPQVGARLHRLRAFGHDLLRTPNDPAVHVEDPFFWGAYVMAPWCNRIAAELIEFGSRRIHLAPNFGDGTAIHGQVYSRPWRAQDDGSLVVSAGGEGWPWRYEVRMRLAVDGASVRIRLDLTNVDDEPMPAGLGIHPWFQKPLRIAIHADRVFPDNLDGDAEPRPVTGPLDLRVLGEIPDDLDATWADVADPAVDLEWPGRVRARMVIETRPGFVVAASPRQPPAVAVEPQTHAPQGIRRLMNGEPAALAMLAPGGTLSIAIRLDCEPLNGS
jgi:aldose 1-epimerase